ARVASIGPWWAQPSACQNGSIRVEAPEGGGGVRGVRETNFPKPLVSGDFGRQSSFPLQRAGEKRIGGGKRTLSQPAPQRVRCGAWTLASLSQPCAARF